MVHAFPTQRPASLEGRVRVAPGDLRGKRRERKVGNLILVVLDVSASMETQRRMVATKGAVLSLLRDAYVKRDRVGLISFGGYVEPKCPLTLDHGWLLQNLARAQALARAELYASEQAARAAASAPSTTAGVDAPCGHDLERETRFPGLLHELVHARRIALHVDFSGHLHQLAAQDLDRQRVLQFALDGSFKRTGAIIGIVANFGQIGACFRADNQSITTLR